MGTDLNTPLGQDRKVKPQRHRLLSGRGLLASGALFGLLGFSAYALRPVDGLKQAPSPEITGTTPAKPAAGMVDIGTVAPLPSQASVLNGMQKSSPRSGANVVRSLTDDGVMVTKYTPGQRTQNGAVLLDATSIGQDPRMATIPVDELLEKSPFGPLPVVSADGLRPVDRYARPWSGAHGVRVAIVVGGLGLSQTGTQAAIRQLPEEVTLAFASSGNSLQRWMQEARRSGHEILLQVPFEPFDYPDNDPGADTLLTSLSAEKNLASLHKAMGKITNYTGIMNYLGGRYLSDQKAMDPVMKDIAARGLLFLDDGTSAQSLGPRYGKALNMPYSVADVQLDQQVDEKAILGKLDELERIARRNGSAIGVASAFDESVAAISQWSEEATMRGIEIVGVSAIATDNSTATAGN
nr:divergent polysaccharide deacetylase family protein [uncultured Gellertiella sp.]